MAEACRLPELARRLAPDLWNDYEQAMGVRDRKIGPPREWGPQIAADAEAFVERMLAERLHAFDTSDLRAASRYLPITSSWDLESWKRETADWPQQLAKLRQRRDAYERETRDVLRESALEVVSAKSARDLVRVLGKFFVVILKVEMTTPGSVVRATPKGGERRRLDRAEVLEAGIDLARNALTIDGTEFAMVEVEPAGAGDGEGRSRVEDGRKAPATDEAIAAWAVARQGELKAAGRKHGRDVVVPLVARNFGVKQDVVRLVWRNRPGAAGNKRR